MFHIFNSSLKIGRALPMQPCILCGVFSHDGVWCKACDADLPRLGSAHCPVCGLPTLNGEICGKCLKHAPNFETTSAAFAYAFPIDKLVQAVKFSGRFALTNQLADALASRITTRPDYIVAMPLHPLRLRERGFNQSHLLAQRLAKHFGISLLSDVCSRTRNTPPQSSLPWQERGKNMRGAFNCSADLTGKHIAIVDDVMTTGTTIEELARTLRHSGAIKVSAWVLARTLPH
jgi:ComF family protein